MPKNGKTTGKKVLFSGVLILIPAAFLAKLIGLFYKVPLLSVVGVEGMAYFLSAYHIYALLFVISASGLPTALSLQISRAVAAGKEKAVPRILFVSLLLFLSLGAAGTLCLLFFCGPIAVRLSMREAAPAVAAVAPALLLSAFTGASRGYFQGYHNMVPTAVSEVLEAGGKLCFGLLFASAARRAGRSVAEIAAAAIFGIPAGIALSAIFLLICLAASAMRRRDRRKNKAIAGLPSHGSLLFETVRLAFPITVSASVMSLVTLLDTVLISGRLQASGYAPSVANALYSSYGNLAVPLYNLIPSLLTPVALALTPLLGAACAKNDTDAARATLCTAMRLIALLAFPAALGLAVFSGPILTLIFPKQIAAVSVATPLLSLLSISVVPAALITLTGAALQATGHATVPVLSMAAGAVVKLISGAVLLSVPSVNITGAPVSTLLCNLTVLTVNLVVLKKVLPFRLSPFRDFYRPFLAAVCGISAGIGVFCAFLRFPAFGKAGIIFTLGTTAVLYVLLALLFRAVEREDILSLPGGAVICTILEKCKLLKEVKNDDKRSENQNVAGKKRIRHGGSSDRGGITAVAGRMPVGQGADTSLDSQ